MVASTLRTVRRLESISEQQCEEWVRNEGRINPITRARINPNLTSESSMNVLISNKCFENFGISRQGNPYNNMVRTSPQNTRTSPQNTRTSPQNTRTSPQNARTSPQNARTSPQNARTSPQNARTSPQNARTSPQNARTSPQNARNEINVTRVSPNSTMRRKTGVVYRNNNGNIKIDRNLDYTMQQLKTWWNNGVMQKDDTFHLKNPNNNRKIKENSTTYNRILQCADTICLIPANLSFVYDNGYLSEESCEILKSIRKEIDEDDWKYEDMVNYFKSPEASNMSKMTRFQKYRQYISIFNSRERMELLTQEILNVVGSVDKKSLSTKSIGEDDNINTLCLNKFVDVHDKYKKFRNKIMRTCNENNKCSLLSNDDIKKLLNTFNKKEEIVYYNIVNHPSIISLFANYITNLDKNILNTSKMEVVNYKFNEHGKLLFSDGSDMGGLSRQMITNISNELFDMKIFTKPQNSTKYFLNPQFVLSGEHKSILQIIININPIKSETKIYLNDLIQSDEFYSVFYKFLGELMSFFLMNSFKLPYHLSSYILNCMKIKPNKIKDIDHVMYVLNDFPDISNSILNMMKNNPEEIETYDIEYNDIYKIQYDKENGDHVTSENLEQYFIDFAKHLNIHNTTAVSENKNLNIDFSNYYEQFFIGFNNSLRKLFQQKDFSYMTIDKMLTKEELNNEILYKLSDNIFKNISFTKNNNVDDIEEYNDRGLQYVKKYQEYIDNLLLNKNTGFSKEEHNNFVKKMLEFWTGIDFFKPEINYKILVVMNETRGYPVSHTCFNRVDFPLCESEKQFFEKLKTSVENSHNTFTIAGGKKNTFKYFVK